MASPRALASTLFGQSFGATEARLKALQLAEQAKQDEFQRQQMLQQLQNQNLGELSKVAQIGTSGLVNTLQSFQDQSNKQAQIDLQKAGLELDKQKTASDLESEKLNRELSLEEENRRKAAEASRLKQEAIESLRREASGLTQENGALTQIKREEKQFEFNMAEGHKAPQESLNNLKKDLTDVAKDLNKDLDTRFVQGGPDAVRQTVDKYVDRLSGQPQYKNIPKEEIRGIIVDKLESERKSRKAEGQADQLFGLDKEKSKAQIGQARASTAKDYAETDYIRGKPNREAAKAEAELAEMKRKEQLDRTQKELSAVTQQLGDELRAIPPDRDVIQMLRNRAEDLKRALSTESLAPRTQANPSSFTGNSNNKLLETKPQDPTKATSDGRTETDYQKLEKERARAEQLKAEAELKEKQSDEIIKEFDRLKSKFPNADEDALIQQAKQNVMK